MELTVFHKGDGPASPAVSGEHKGNVEAEKSEQERATRASIAENMVEEKQTVSVALAAF